MYSKTTKKFSMGSVALALMLMVTVFSCKKDEDVLNSPSAATETPDPSEKGTNPDELALQDEAQRNYRGFIYTESNDVSQNEILCYQQQANGSLNLIATVASGGNGVGPGPVNLGLDSQGALAISENKNWLFAVNGGSNSISSFRIHGNGSVTLENTVASGGTIPSSLCIHGHYLYVLNLTSSSINGFMVGPGGTLTEIPGTNLPLSAAMADPAQIAFSPNGRHLYVTERMTDKITAYNVDMNGVATYDASITSAGHTPFGFCFARDNYMVVSNANVVAPGVPVPNGSSCTSYGGTNSGNLNAQNGAVANNQSASCWVATTKFGRFAYVTNTGSNTLSSYYVSPWGNLYLIDGNAAPGNAPKDIIVADDNYHVYAINSAAPQSIGVYHRTLLGGLSSAGTVPNLPPYAAGLVAR